MLEDYTCFFFEYSHRKPLTKYFKRMMHVLGVRGQLNILNILKTTHVDDTSLRGGKRFDLMPLGLTKQK